MFVYVVVFVWWLYEYIIRNTESILAGIVDGEGCISIVRQKSKESVNWSYSLLFIINGNDSALIQYVHHMVGVGSSTTDGHLLMNNLYRWQTRIQDAVEILRAIYPYLVIKKAHADIAFEFASIETIRSGRGGVVDQSVLSHRQELKDRITKMKGTSGQRGRKAKD